MTSPHHPDLRCTRCGREGHHASSCKVQLPQATKPDSAPKPPVDRGGIRDIEGLKRRCVVDAITDCWVYAGGSKRTRASVAVQVTTDTGRIVTTLGAAVGLLSTGSLPPRGKLWVAICGNTRCGNPEHRKLKPRGHQSVVAAQHGRCGGPARAQKIAATRRLNSRYSDELIAEVWAADGLLREVAERYGMAISYVSRIRRGEARVVGGAMSSMAHILGGDR